MKRILFVIPLFISVLSFAQDYNGKRVRATDELKPPFDTTKTKCGFAIINDTFYVGNCVYWKKTLLYIPIDQQPGDILQIDPTNTFITNARSSPASCNNTSNIGLSHVDNLTWAYTSGFYNISCNQYTLATGATITLDDFDGTPGQFRTDAIILRANEGIVILKGDNSDDQVGGTKTVDPATEILLSYVTINSDNQIVNVASTTVYYDNHAGVEWSHATFGGATIAYNYGTVKLAPSDSSIHITVLPNNSGFRLTAPTTQTSGGKRLTGYIRHDATVSNTRNWVIRKMNGVNQVSGSAAITLTAQRGYNKTAAFNNQWQLFSIPLDGTEGFGGQDTYTGFEFRNTGTGGTVNQYFDSVRVESGITINNGGGGGIQNIFVRNDSLYYTINGGNVFVGMLNGTNNNAVNNFSIKPNHITTTEHTAFGMSEIVNGTIAILQTEGEGHAHVAGRFPVDYYSTNQGKGYTRVALPLTGISGAASNDIGNVAGGLVNGALWAVSTDYINADEAQATRIWLWKSSNGITWTNPVQVVYDTTTYDLLTVYGHIIQNGSRIMIPTYGSRSGGTTVAVLLISDNGGSTWSAVEMRTGNITDNNVTETDILVTGGTNIIAISRREEHDPALTYSSDNGSTWSDGGILTIATDKGFTDRWHAPYLYKEGSEIFCLFSDRRNWNVPQISVTSNYTSAATWNASTVRIVASSIIQEGWGAYDFGYVSTLGSGENRMLVMYDTSPTSSVPLDLDHNITDILISPLPLTPKPLFIGAASNVIFSGGGNAGENDNAIVFERLSTRQDNLAMLQGDSSTFIVKETGRYHISGNIHLSATAFATISELNCYVYNPSEDTTVLNNNSRIQIGVIGVGGSLGTPFLNLNGTLALFKGQLIKFRVNVDADETLDYTERAIFTIEKIDERSELSGGTNINQTIYDTTAADQVLRDTVGVHNTRLIALENAGSGGASGPDGFNGTATVPVTANMAANLFAIKNTAYPGNLFDISAAGRVRIGDVDGGVNGIAITVDDPNNQMLVRLGSLGTFQTASLADTSNYVPESYTTMAWVTDHINNASGGGASAFTGLSDVPSSYSGQALKALRVNAAATGVEFYTPSSSSPAIAGAISGATGGRVLYTGTGGILQHDSHFLWDSTLQKLTATHIFATKGISIGTYYSAEDPALEIIPTGTYSVGVYDAFSNARFIIRSTGSVGYGQFLPGTGIHVEQRILASNMRGYVMQRASGQTEHMYDWSDESGNVLSAINENGQFTSRIAIVSKATSYTATISDATIVVTATGQTITLPTSVGLDGKTYTIKLTASGSSTVATTSSQTIDGSTTYSLASQYKYVTVQSNGANWVVIANN